jgi:hypothetical protein
MFERKWAATHERAKRRHNKCAQGVTIRRTQNHQLLRSWRPLPDDRYSVAPGAHHATRGNAGIQAHCRSAGQYRRVRSQSQRLIVRGRRARQAKQWRGSFGVPRLRGLSSRSKSLKSRPRRSRRKAGTPNGGPGGRNFIGPAGQPGGASRDQEFLSPMAA